MSRPAAPSVENDLPAPLVPQELCEILQEYPELIQRLQDVLDDYVRRPNPITPFDGAIWALEGRLESFISEAHEELESAKLEGVSQRIEIAKNNLISPIPQPVVAGFATGRLDNGPT
ncbi:hypothetical protein [Xanthomonas cucurbitae]|uniref:Uncharacterized protein n=1 Tax=Xanthomonas cucurbitae TaxID=56453 RepID=A0ABY7YFG8_9XANT|nr:hypothetical protein [Xanthomonas cucurbitae]WDM68664.1 hypothetical protein K6981_05080 [Xanthomonas cucurbitae]WDM72537.1 hypothetical protein K6978_05075 [Xanthomonas cucurbitae]